MGLLRLSQHLMPWLPAGDHDDRQGGVAMETETVRVEDLMLLVDTLLVNTATEDENVTHTHAHTHAHTHTFHHPSTQGPAARCL